MTYSGNGSGHVVSFNEPLKRSSSRNEERRFVVIKLNSREYHIQEGLLKRCKFSETSQREILMRDEAFFVSASREVERTSRTSMMFVMLYITQPLLVYAEDDNYSHKAASAEGDLP
ncbi:hypothetical protein J6590_082241, partial [Homalodisca vitripennis]